MSITWIVQDNLGSTSSTADSIKRACENEGQDYAPIQVIPFSYENEARKPTAKAVGGCQEGEVYVEKSDKSLD